MAGGSNGVAAHTICNWGAAELAHACNYATAREGVHVSCSKGTQPHRSRCATACLTCGGRRPQRLPSPPGRPAAMQLPPSRPLLTAGCALTHQVLWLPGSTRATACCALAHQLLRLPGSPKAAAWRGLQAGAGREHAVLQRDGCGCCLNRFREHARRPEGGWGRQPTAWRGPHAL